MARHQWLIRQQIEASPSSSLVTSASRSSKCRVSRSGSNASLAPSQVGECIGSEISARVTEHCFYSLESPVLRVAGFDTPYPAARVEEEYLPDLDRVLDAVDRTFGW